MVKWVESEKFRAELLKTSGLALCTPFSAIIFFITTNQNFFFHTLNLFEILIAALMFISGLLAFSKAYDILMKLDLERND